MEGRVNAGQRLSDIRCLADVLPHIYIYIYIYIYALKHEDKKLKILANGGHVKILRPYRTSINPIYVRPVKPSNANRQFGKVVLMCTRDS